MALRTGSTPSEEEWRTTLLEIGISEDFAIKYAAAFHEQQLQIHLLKHISDEDLRDNFSVKLIGHRLAIRHGMSQLSLGHDGQSTSIANAPSAKPQVRHKSPQLQPTMTPSSFRAFKSHWHVYKQLVGIQDNSPNAAAQLFSLTCTDHPEIRQTVADHNPNHLTLSEPDYLDMLRKLLTARATPETYRNKFFNMVQGPDESCQQWLKRLQEVAPDCEFSIPCNEKGVYHRFDETLLRSKFILGMHNTSMKQDLLTKCLDLTTLDEVFNYATRMEATARDVSQSLPVAEIYIDQQSTSEDEDLNRISTFKKLQKPQHHRSSKKPVFTRKSKPCDGCGSTQHGNPDRQTKCPAWKKSCNRCGKRGHFGKVCRAEDTSDCANAVIAIINDEAHKNELELSVTPVAIKSCKKGISVKVYPDTGATVCVAGLFILRKLGMTLSQLKPTSRRIVTATGNEIHCKGKFKLQMSVGTSTTTQDMFVCVNIKRVYLSRTGCVELKIVPEDFPNPMTVPSPSCTPQPPNLPKRPLKVPYPPTEENIPLLQKYLEDAFSESGFKNDKTAVFPKMLGVTQAHIHLQEKAKPYCRTTPNSLPYFWRGATKELLDQWVQRGMIEKNAIGTPTPWCHPMVITPKKSNSADPKLRLTVDLQHLNSQCIRELHHVEPPFKLASQIPTHTYKTLLDAVDGYQAVELDEESRPLTAFITQWGCFHFLRVPAGLIDSGDKYTSRFDQIIQHIPRKVKCVDDTLLYDSSISDAFFHTWDFISTCASHGIVLNKEKFKFCKKEITFAGFKVTPTGIQPSDNTLSAIKDFPTPTSTTDIRSWFGLVRQVAYAHSVSEDLAPFRCLLQHQEGKKPKFEWNAQLQHAFETSKKHVLNSVADGIQSFDPQRHTCLQCDWSKNGIGFLLLQKHCICKPPDPTDPTLQACCETGWKLVYAGSRFTNPAESRYSPTEGEALAVAWALKTSRLFTLGSPKLIVVTDHKPLLGIFNGRDLDSIKNPRIRRLKEHTLDYAFQIKHCPGKFHVGADALSRNPARSQRETDSDRDEISEICESNMSSLVESAFDSINEISNEHDNTDSHTIITLEKFELTCLQDAEYMELHNLVTSGFPTNRSVLPDHAKVYWPLAQKGLLTTFNNIVLYQEKLIVPKAIRTYMMQVLHSAHQGCTGMIARATKSIHWPGIRKCLMSYQMNCRTCSEISPSQPREPLELTPLAERPFQVICSDLFQLNGRFYLIVVDRFSGFLHIFYSRESPNHKFLQKHIRDIFKRYGRPDEVHTDGGPQFQSTAFQQFLASWGVKHRVSSPYYPQSNGRAELGVKTAKRLLRNNTDATDGGIDNDKVARAVLQYHNTPIQGCPMSPAQLLFGRELADFLPVNPKAYKLHPHWEDQVKTSQRNRLERHKQLTQRYNSRTRKLQPLTVGKKVLIQNMVTKRWGRPAVVIEVMPNRKYRLKLDDTGNVTIRNRRFLKPASKLLQQHGSVRVSGPIISPQQAAHTSNHNVHPAEVEREHMQQTEESVEQSSSSPPQHPVQDQSSSHNCDKEPLALRRLRPFNAPGFNE